jgi:hypothetical protein
MVPAIPSVFSTVFPPRAPALAAIPLVLTTFPAVVVATPSILAPSLHRSWVHGDE